VAEGAASIRALLQWVQKIRVGIAVNIKLRQGIDPVRRNDQRGKRRPMKMAIGVRSRRRVRVVEAVKDSIGCIARSEVGTIAEIPRAIPGGRNCIDPRLGLVQEGGLPRAKKEGLVLAKRTPNCAPKIIEVHSRRKKRVPVGVSSLKRITGTEIGVS